MNYSLSRCAGCGLVFLNPRPALEHSGVHHREDGYDPFLSLRQSRGLLDTAYVRLRNWTLKWKKRLARRITADHGKVLDIGCGTGEFLKVLMQDYQVEGIEPEPQAAQWARERFGLKVHTGYLADIPLEDGKYDLVTLWHVLEHIPDPAGELNRIHRLLSNPGKLLVALPNIRSLDARIYGSCWIAIDAPRHLWHFTHNPLILLAAKCGFSLVQSGMLPLDTFYNTLYSELLCREIKGAGSLLLAPLRLPLATALSLLVGAVSGQHSGIYYIFRKT